MFNSPETIIKNITLGMKPLFPIDEGVGVLPGVDDKCLDIDTWKIVSINDYHLTDEEKEIATTLIQDGWYGNFDELIKCIKELAK